MPTVGEIDFNLDLNEVIAELEDFHFGRLRIDDALKNGWFDTPDPNPDCIPTRAEALAMIHEWDSYLETFRDVYQTFRNLKSDYWRKCFYPPGMEGASIWSGSAVLVDFRLIYWQFNVVLAENGDPDGLIRRHRPAYKLSYKTIAEVLQISADSVSHWHSGKAHRAGNPVNAKKIADFYNVSLSRAFYWNVPGKPVPMYPDERDDPIVYRPYIIGEDRDNG